MTILFGVVCIIIRLAVEAYQEHKANEYANKVVRRYS
mgnify:CR=1 FL=1